MSESNFNDPKDKEYIKEQLKIDQKDSIIPIDFEIISEKSGYLSEIKDPDSMIDSINNISDTYTKFGEDFGIEIKFDVESVSSTFKSIITTDAENVFKIYLAKTTGKVKLAIFNKILVSITTLVDRVTQKDILESDNIELSVGLIEKLLYLMEKLNFIHQEIGIDSADLVLQNVAKEIKVKDIKGNSSAEATDEDVMNVLRYLKNNKSTEG